jgi:glycosyltransferase involved in cell wall biosynthesis
MACGVPVVGSRSGGLPELVGADGGLLVEVPETWEAMPVPDPGQMAEAVTAIMGDWPRWSRAARARAEARFGTDAWVARHAAIFARVRGGR